MYLIANGNINPAYNFIKIKYNFVRLNQFSFYVKDVTQMNLSVPVADVFQLTGGVMMWKTVQTTLMNKDVVSGIIAGRSERNTELKIQTIGIPESRGILYGIILWYTTRESAPYKTSI